MEILSANTEEAEAIAFIIREANKDVAHLFGLTSDNAPKHPSFYTKNWVLCDFKRGEKYFLYRHKEILVGCIAFEQPDSDTAYLNRLSVLPDYRHSGIGESLVNHVIAYSKDRNISIVSIGIIAEHTVLKKWYLKLGFIEGISRKFNHLPFNVTYMSYAL